MKALQPRSLFDAGFGNGRWLEWCVKNGVRWAGVEIDASQVEACDHPDAVRASVTSVPFDSGRWDVVLLVEVIEHLPDEESVVKAIKESYRLCKQGGHVIITTPNCEDVNVLRENHLTYFHFNEHHWLPQGTEYGLEHSHNHWIAFTPERLKKVMALAAPTAKRQVLRKMPIKILRNKMFYKLWGVVEKPCQ